MLIVFVVDKLNKIDYIYNIVSNKKYSNIFNKIEYSKREQK